MIVVSLHRNSASHLDIVRHGGTGSTQPNTVKNSETSIALSKIWQPRNFGYMVEAKTAHCVNWPPADRPVLNAAPPLVGM